MARFAPAGRCPSCSWRRSGCSGFLPRTETGIGPIRTVKTICVSHHPIFGRWDSFTPLTSLVEPHDVSILGGNEGGSGTDTLGPIRWDDTQVRAYFLADVLVYFFLGDAAELGYLT